MSIQPPPAVAAYIAATNDQDTAAMLACFTADAKVDDSGDGHVLEGTAAIGRWIGETTVKYRIKLVVTDIEAGASETHVTALASGDFPGSPIEFHYHFVLKDNKIAELRIHV